LDLWCWKFRSRAAILLVLLHVGFMVLTIWTTGVLVSLNSVQWGEGPLYGSAAFISFALGGLFALPCACRGCWEVFIHAHHVFIPVGYVCALLHSQQLQWLLIMPGAFWVIDLVWKLSAYCVGRATIISADVLPSEDSGFVTTKLTMQMRRPFRYEPGSHVYINLPFVSLFQWHPFSISSSATSPSDPFTLHIRAEGTGSSWTRTLAVEVGRTLHMDAPASKMLSNACAFVRGPFRSRALPILSYPVIVLVAGGIGITPIISIFSRVQHLLANAEKGQGGFKMVHLVWICRAQQPLLNWFASEFLSAQSLDPPGTLSVELYCTSRHPPCAVAASYVPEIRIETLSAAAGLQTCSHSSVEMAGLALPNAVPRSDVARSLFPMKLELPRSNELSKFNSSNKLTLNFGRPDLSALCYKIASKLPALEVTVPNVAVVACGPSALCSAAQDAAERAGFQFHREGFQL